MMLMHVAQPETRELSATHGPGLQEKQASSGSTLLALRSTLGAGAAIPQVLMHPGRCRPAAGGDQAGGLSNIGSIW